MTAWLLEYAGEVGTMVAISAPYLLVGFVVAGLLKTFVREERVYAHLGRDDLRSVLRASIYGVPIPLCSCSVIPTAMALNRSGASKGATAAFLISTPETGVDSMSVTWALFDPLMTVVRPFAAFASAVLTGSTVNVLVKRAWDAAPAPRPEPESCCGHDSGKLAGEGGGVAPARRGSRLVESLRWTFGPLLDDLTPWFVVGFLASGLIAMLVPVDLFGERVPTGWTSSLLMLALGTPMYICATASTPVAAALVAKGLDPGAALVFLLVGPATNVTTMLVVSRFLGKRICAVYLASTAVVALALGFALNGVYGALGIDLASQVASTLHEHLGPVEIATGVLLGALLARSAWRLRLLPRTFAALGRLASPRAQRST